MPAIYRWLDYELLYPENWTVEDEPEFNSMSIHSPSGAFLSLTCPPDLQAAFERARFAMADEYDEVETENVSRLLGEALLEGLTQRFIYLDLIVTSHLMKLEMETPGFRPLLIQMQGEDRDLEQQQMVFDAILLSLIQKFPIG